MCGIIGIFDDEESVKKVVVGLSVIQNRGRDGYGIYSPDEGEGVEFSKSLKKLSKTKLIGSSCVGHCLHSIVGFVPQPLKRIGVMVANCEIYNWEELDDEYGLGAKNDSELILQMLNLRGPKEILSVLDELDGVYAFAYWRDGKVYVCRDIIGVKPVWYTESNSPGSGFGFCSERKALEANGFTDVKELNPREVLVYDVKKKKISFLKRKFFSIKPEVKDSKEMIKKKLIGLLGDAIVKRVPDQKFGILFSGGVDSTFIAHMCKKLGLDFTCYTAVLEEKGMEKAQDLEWAEKASKELGLKLKVKKLKLDEVPGYLEKVVPLIEDNNVVKVGVGLTFYVACQLAVKDGIKAIFSGLGSEELFAGYERHKGAADINDECLSGIRKIYERDLYRDDVVSMNNNLELRLPFLDKKLVDYSLKVPAKYKLQGEENKKILREVAIDLGLPSVFANRKKKAAQYGSKFDRAIAKLAKKDEHKLKSAYLEKFYSRGNPKLGVLFSGGKDSALALHVMKKQNYPISCLISMKSKNQDSYMFHTPNIDLVGLQAEAMGIPLVLVETKGEKEKELKDLEKAILQAKKKYGVEGIVTGALYSQYQRERVEKICDKLGLKIFSPLWHMDQEKEMRMLVDEGYEIVMGSIAAEGLDSKWLGKRIGKKEVDRLVKLHDKIRFHVAGEGGEFESLVLDGPEFSKRINILDSEVVSESEIVARLVVKKTELKEK